LNLDDYMALVWKTYGTTEMPYTVHDLNQILNSYAGQEFGDHFFNNFIFESGMPNYKEVFKRVGLIFEIKNTIEFGAFIRNQIIVNHPKIGTSAYKAGFQKGDKILRIGGMTLEDNTNINAVLSTFNEGDEISVGYERFGTQKE